MPGQQGPTGEYGTKCAVCIVRVFKYIHHDIDEVEASSQL